MSQNTTSAGWKKQSGYIWSMIGSAVGFANILSFSACAYKNGGGAFLIPYAAALILLGVPLLLLEGRVGSHWKLPLVGAFGKVLGSTGKTVGWLAVIACGTIGGFYIVLTGYSVAYTWFAATSVIPADTATFFTRDFLQISPSLFDVGSFSWPVFIATGVVAIFSWIVLTKDIKDGVEKISSIVMPLLAIIMFIFAMVVSLLPGGIDGIIRFLTPDFSKLTDITLWRDVFGQLLFSLSLGLGLIVGYSRHTNERIDVVKAMKWVAIGDFSVSFIAGCAIFGAVAHMSAITGTPFNEIITSDSTFEIGFVIFPKILQQFGAFAPIIGTIFFFSVFIAGVTGVFSIIESVAGNIEVEYATTRKQAVMVTMILHILLAMLFSTGCSSHLIDALAPMLLGTNMLFGSLMLITAFVFLCPDIGIHFKRSPIRHIVPLFLFIIFVGNLQQEFASLNAASYVRWGWFVGAIVVSMGLTYYSKKIPNKERVYVSA